MTLLGYAWQRVLTKTEKRGIIPEIKEGRHNNMLKQYLGQLTEREYLEMLARQRDRALDAMYTEVENLDERHKTNVRTMLRFFNFSHEESGSNPDAKRLIGIFQPIYRELYEKHPSGQNSLSLSGFVIAGTPESEETEEPQGCTVLEFFYREGRAMAHVNYCYLVRDSDVRYPLRLFFHSNSKALLDKKFGERGSERMGLGRHSMTQRIHCIDNMAEFHLFTKDMGVDERN